MVRIHISIIHFCKILGSLSSRKQPCRSRQGCTSGTQQCSWCQRNKRSRAFMVSVCTDERHVESVLPGDIQLYTAQYSSIQLNTALYSFVQLNTFTLDNTHTHTHTHTHTSVARTPKLICIFLIKFFNAFHVFILTCMLIVRNLTFPFAIALTQSPAMGRQRERTVATFAQIKATGTTVRFVTVVAPFDGPRAPNMRATIAEPAGSTSVTVSLWREHDDGTLLRRVALSWIATQ